MSRIHARLALPAILLMVALAALAIACADEKTATTSPSTATASATASSTETASPTASASETATASETAPSTETTEPGEGTEFVVELQDNVFVPAEITVPANTPVKFVAKNTGTAIHNMHILSMATEGKDFTSDTIVAAGTESEFEATFTKTGTVQFQCDFHVPNMVGTITVQ